MLTTTILWVNSEMRKFIPVAHCVQARVSYMWQELSLDFLQPINGGPQLAAVVQPRMDETPKKSEHYILAPPSKGPTLPFIYQVLQSGLSACWRRGKEDNLTPRSLRLYFSFSIEMHSNLFSPAVDVIKITLKQFVVLVSCMLWFCKRNMSTFQECPLLQPRE